MTKFSVRLSCVLVLLVAAGVAARAQTTPSPDVRDDQFSVTYQINPAHTGAITLDQSFAPPLRVLWNVTTEGLMTSYPLIARGKVFIWVSHFSSSDPQPQYAGRLYALDKATGVVIWQADIPATYGEASLAYGDGHVFLLTENGILDSFDADTGAQVWSVQLPRNVFYAPPTAANHEVFVEGDNGRAFLYAVDETNGSVLWSQPVDGGSSSPALSGEGVFVASGCHAWDFNPATGVLIWEFSGACFGGGGATLAYYRGLLYDTETLNLSNSPTGNILDANTGEVIGTFGGAGPLESIFPPALKGGAGYYTQNDFTAVGAFERQSGSTLWSHNSAVDFLMPPIVVNGTVFTFDNAGILHAYDRISGDEVWNANSGSPAPNSGPPMLSAGMAAGEGILVVPAGQNLYALVPVSAE